MICPKCAHEADGDTCARCGVIKSKYREQLLGPPPAADNMVGTLATSVERKVAASILVAGMLLLLNSIMFGDQLPALDKVASQLYHEPIQTPTDTAPFEVEVGEHTYLIEPLYDYQLSGLVVSQHNTQGWMDMYHQKLWGDFLNIKDICVVWGNNIAREVYQEMEFSSGAWTCYYKSPSQGVWKAFDQDQLSNNHLLASSPEVQDAVMSAEIGDQISFTGYLANYSNPANSFNRKSSVVRTDRGNGACETVYLESFEIIRAENTLWQLAFWVALLMMAGGIFFWFYLD